jgi:hypothetical protein
LIKKHLREAFQNSGIFFSEDDELRARTKHLEDVLVEEMVHGLAADCILILDVSRGAHVEVDQFATNAKLAPKIRLLIPTRFVGTKGLVGVVHQRVRVCGFTDEEFEACRVARDLAVNVVESVAIRKLIGDALSE